MTTIRRQLSRPRPSWGWQDDAACRGEDLVLFFGLDGERQPEKDIRERKAKAICAQCPVRNECLDYALSAPEKYGLWGSLNEDERASERRRRMRQPQPVAVRRQVSEKHCNACDTTLPAAEFGADARSGDGLNVWCRPCTNEAARRRRREAREAVAS